MIRARLLRTLAALTAAAAGTAGPLNALMHGVQHERAAAVILHHGISCDGHAHHTDNILEACGSHDESHASPKPDESSGAEDHDHVRLESGRTAGPVLELSPAAAVTVLGPLATVARPVPPVNQSAELAVIVATATGPPPPSRAPPRH